MLKINLHEIKGIDCYHKFYFFPIHSSFTSVTIQSIPYLYYSLYSCCSSLIFYPLLFHFGFVPSLFIPFQTFSLLSGRNIIFYIIYIYIYISVACIHSFVHFYVSHTFYFIVLNSRAWRYHFSFFPLNVARFIVNVLFHLYVWLSFCNLFHFYFLRFQNLKRTGWTTVLIAFQFTFKRCYS